jgi:hypothetical protein
LPIVPNAVWCAGLVAVLTCRNAVIAARMSEAMAVTGAFGALVSKRKQATISSATCLAGPRTGCDPTELLIRDLDDRELMKVVFTPNEAASA